MKTIARLSVDLIKPDPDQPRKEFSDEGIEELANSIKSNGLLQPITVRPIDGLYTNKGYIIIAGERRYRAVCSLGENEIDALIYTGDKAKELQLIENINRVDLNPMEIAVAYRAYLDNNHTIEELCEAVGKAKGQVTWSLGLLKLRPEIQHLIKRGQMQPSVGGYLSKLSENGQMTALRTMTSEKLSVSECWKLCEAVSTKENQPDMMPAEPKLSDREVEARHRVQNALDRACTAFKEIQQMELDTPGITAQAIADKLDITKESVEMLMKLVSQFRNSLEERRVKALC